jgi:5-oxoprolinase (ATP-hydrolysing)
VQDNAEEAVRRVLDVLKDGQFEYEMDSGARIAVRIAIDRAAREATIDFTGTSAQQPNNFNAPSAVCKAAVLYVFRTLVDNEIPMNAGCLKPLRIVIPDGSMLAPRFPAAVVAGNVETSQAITDTLYGALGVLAASQGTMNNFTFGNERYQYYETIAGGAGAGPEFDGASVVQTHDQLAPHRPRGPGVALPGCGSMRFACAPAAVAWARIAAAMAASAACASSSR